MSAQRLRAILTDHLFLALVLVAFLVFYGDLPLEGDRFLAVPIAIESGTPGSYPLSDLLVQSGLHSGFHLYVALGKIVGLGIPAALLWEAAFLSTLFLFVVLALRLFETLTERKEIAVLAAAVLMSMPPFRGGLAFSPVPWTEFITGSVGNCLVLLVVLWTWRRRWMRAGLTAGILCNIHPSMGSIAVALVVAAGALRWREDRRKIVGALLVGCAAAMPNIISMSSHLFGASTATVTTQGIYELVAPFQKQYSIRQHIDPFLGFYSGMLALAVSGAARLGAEKRRDLLVALAALHTLIAIYVLGVEAFHSSFLGIFFWFRATAYVKILAIPMWMMLIVRPPPMLRSAAGRCALTLLLLAAAYVQNHAASTSFLLLAVGVLLYASTRGPGWLIAGSLLLCALCSLVAIGWRRLGIPVAPASVRGILDVSGAVLAICSLPFFLRTASARQQVEVAEGVATAGAAASHPWRWLSAAVAVLIASVLARHPYTLGVATLLPTPWSRVQARVQMDVPAGSLRGVEEWARHTTSRTSLFAMPPAHTEAKEFRVRGARGLFVSTPDLAQLTYAPAAFVEARRRAELLGVRVRDGRYDDSDFLRIDASRAEQIRLAGATHLVFPHAETPRLPFAVTYEDSGWVVYDLLSRR